MTYQLCAVLLVNMCTQKHQRLFEYTQCKRGPQELVPDNKLNGEIHHELK